MDEDDLAQRLRMTPEDAEHDAECEHFQEAVGLAMTVMQQDGRIERLEEVLEQAVDALELLNSAIWRAYPRWAVASRETGVASERIVRGRAALNQEEEDNDG